MKETLVDYGKKEETEEEQDENETKTFVITWSETVWYRTVIDAHDEDEAWDAFWDDDGDTEETGRDVNDDAELQEV